VPCGDHDSNYEYSVPCGDHGSNYEYSVVIISASNLLKPEFRNKTSVDTERVVMFVHNVCMDRHE